MAAIQSLNTGLSQNVMTAEKDLVSIFGIVEVGATGAVDGYCGSGIVGVTRADVGKYSVTIAKGWSRLLGFSFSLAHSATSGVATVQVFEDAQAVQTDMKADGNFVIQCYDYAGAAVDPAQASRLYIRVDVVRSPVGGFTGSGTLSASTSL